MPGRFTDPWWRQYDKPTGGYRDSSGFVNRLPLRLESTELMVFGTVDAKKMWAEFDDEDFTPILVGGKAVISIWFNNFTDTDCGGSYLETWYNTFVTRKSDPVSLPMESPLSVIIAHERAQSFLQRVICGDAPGNPGAAMKAICGGREIWGFPKHPDLAQIRHSYGEEGGKRARWEFDAAHSGNAAVSLRCALPDPSAGAAVVPVEVVTPDNANISAPRLGGTHKGHNGAKQTFYGSTIKCTQHVGLWDPKTDTLKFGTDAHYAQPISRWDFVPLVKAHVPDFKIAAFAPNGWVSADAAAAAVADHEKRHAAGTLLGKL